MQEAFKLQVSELSDFYCPTKQYSKIFNSLKHNLQTLESLPCARGGGARSATEGLAVTFYSEYIQKYRF